MTRLLVSAVTLAFLAGHEAPANSSGSHCWKASPFTLVGAVHLVLAAPAIVFPLARSRRARAMITLLFAVLDLGTVFLVG